MLLLDSFPGVFLWIGSLLVIPIAVFLSARGRFLQEGYTLQQASIRAALWTVGAINLILGTCGVLFLRQLSRAQPAREARPATDAPAEATVNDKDEDDENKNER